MVFAVAQAVVGYLLAEADRRKLGRVPWGLPSAVWALIWFLSLLLGLVLWFFAHRNEIRRAAQAPATPAARPAQLATGPMHASASDFPAYPRPARGESSGGSGRSGGSPGSPSSGPSPGAPDVPPGTSPPAWQPDPGGRYHYRWWSGTEWTAYVSIDGRVQVDTSPDQRIGPY